MAESKCPGCGFTYFEVVKHKPQNAENDVSLVQCASCGTVVGTANEQDSENVIKELQEKFQQMEELITTLDHNIRVIAGKIGVR